MHKFVSKDPIGLAGGDVNFYAYVQNNPINFVDPEGKSWIPAVIATGAAVGGWYLYNHNETFRGVVDAVVGAVVPDVGPAPVASILLNPDTLTAMTLLKVREYNVKHAGEDFIDADWASKHPYEALKKLNERKTCK
jgi:uncharacterized protein RhaS with RHS repeats